MVARARGYLEAELPLADDVDARTRQVERGRADLCDPDPGDRPGKRAGARIRQTQPQTLLAGSDTPGLRRRRSRESVTEALAAAGIGFGIHYPVPVHLMPAYAFLGGEALDLPVTVRASREILSLPLHEALSVEESAEVAATLNRIA